MVELLTYKLTLPYGTDLLKKKERKSEKIINGINKA